jgi:hypothetical protein
VRFLFCFPPSDRPSLSPDPSSFRGLEVELFDEVVTSDPSLTQSEEGGRSKVGGAASTGEQRGGVGCGGRVASSILINIHTT